MTNDKLRQLQDIFKVSLMCISIGIFIFFTLHLSQYYHDDAYIVLRYAKNILAGNGLVWNVGERVEGYSSFLWLILISFLGYGNVDLVLASKVLGIVFALGTLIISIVFGKQELPIGVLLLSTNSCFALWAVGGLETVAF